LRRERSRAWRLERLRSEWIVFDLGTNLVESDLMWI
jgi:hypothetical protein